MAIDTDSIPRVIIKTHINKERTGGEGGYMEENHSLNLSWRAKLARSNINILDIHDNTIFLEFTYHPKGSPKVFKWCKTAFPFPDTMLMEDLAASLTKEVLALRKELER